METAATTIPHRRTLWAGRALSALAPLAMAMSAAFKLVGGFTGSKELIDNWVASGYPPGALLPIGAVELACAILFVVPRTAVLGAILVTGYLGGAVATHVRLSQGIWIVPATLGALAWVGLFLREPRLRTLLPLRGDARGEP